MESVPTTMTTTFFEEQSTLLEEAVISLSELSGNEPEICISTEEVLDLYNTQIVNEENEKEVYNILMNLNSVDNLIAGQKRKVENSPGVTKVRKGPISTKCCTICNNIFHVAAPQKKCVSTNCKGELVIQPKEPKILKRPPPMCSKFCATCNKMSEKIPTATKKCIQCHSTLEKVESSTNKSRVVVEMTANAQP